MSRVQGEKATVRTTTMPAMRARGRALITGRKAFEGTSQASLIHAIMGIDPPLRRRARPGDAAARVVDGLHVGDGLQAVPTVPA